MSSRVTLAQIVDNITQLSAAVRPAEFIYDFLTCFGLPKATIARLKGAGGVNLAKKEGCTLLKTKVYFEPLRADLLKAATPMHAIEAAQKDSRIAANKPRFLIATDFKTLAAFDTKRKEPVEFPIGDLHEHYTFFLPLAGMEKSTAHAEAEADVKAAENMAKLYDLIRADNPPKTREERHALNVFLTRLLFCYFAEDTAIFPDKSFTGAVESYTQTDGSDLDSFLQHLFLTLNTEAKARGKTPQHLAEFPYVNGGLFSDSHARQSDVPTFSTKSRQKLIELGTKSWQEINPDIFGSMFQGVVDDEKRAELGMHYTSVPNIMKVIRPLFLDELYAEFEKAKGSEAKLNKLLSRIYRLRLFDPACGSGNFLIIAYKELRRLEMAVFQELQRMAIQLPLSLSGIQVSQFYGIELDDFAHEVAILALWLAEHQMNIEFEAVFGKAPASLPLKDGAKIVCGNATQLNWETICPKNEDCEILILGNPPYLGARMQDEAQKNDLLIALAGQIEAKKVDYIYCWFVKASLYVQNTSHKFAFVTTNSLCQGEQALTLWPWIFSVGLEIQFAHKSFKWANSAKSNAAVICSIVGIARKNATPKKLIEGDLVRSCDHINAYLVNARDTFITRRGKPLSELPLMQYGNMAIDDGELILGREQMDRLVSEHPSAESIVRKIVGADEYLNDVRRWCLWISDASLPTARAIPEVSDRIKRCYEFRIKANDAGTQKLATKPHQFREMHCGTTHSLFVPTVSSERRLYIPCGWLPNSEIVIAPNQVVYDSPIWVFGVVSSQMHMTWMRTVAGRLKTDYRYSSAICYNNFPFPIISAAQKEQLILRSENVLLCREKHPEKTVAQLYDPDKMPAELLAAHRALDQAVEQCYRAKPFTSDEERLEYLFALYEQMTAAAGSDLLTPPTPTPTRAKAKSKKSNFHA